MEYRYDPFWSLVPSLLVGCYVPRSALENGRVAIQVLYRGYSNYTSIRYRYLIQIEMILIFKNKDDWDDTLTSA